MSADRNSRNASILQPISVLVLDAIYRSDGDNSGTVELNELASVSWLMPRASWSGETISLGGEASAAHHWFGTKRKLTLFAELFRLQQTNLRTVEWQPFATRRRSRPDRAPQRCNWRRDTALTGKNRADQLMIAGRLAVAPCDALQRHVACALDGHSSTVRAGSRRWGGRRWKFPFAIKTPG